MKKYLSFFVSIFLLASCTSPTLKTPEQPLIKNTNTESPQDEMMREHCKTMPAMPGCEKYNSTGTPIETTKNTTLNSLVLTDDETVTDAKPTSTVDLKDGQTYDLTISKVRKTINGKSFIMLAYNGSIPGPTFRAPKGSTVTFRVKNTVKELETTIHPHGIRLNYLYDGVPKAQGGAQDPIKVGDIYEQVIHFPDTGLFWYHPHTRDDFEQELGEYGTFLITEPNEKQTYDTESVITLDDILIENGGIAPFESGVTDHVLMGRYGNTVFTNGDSNFSLAMNQGEVKRLFIVNTANTRPFDLSIPGVKMKLVGGDVGYYQNETSIDHLIIGPAERYIIDILPESSGTFSIKSIGGGTNLSLGTLIVTPRTEVSKMKKEFDTLHTYDILSDLSGSLESFRSKSPDKSLTITMEMQGMGNMGGGMMGMGGMGHGMMSSKSHDGIEWEDTMNMMNRQSTEKSMKWIVRDDATKKENMDIDWKFRKGDLVKIRITNDEKDTMHPMQHPFHFHGQRFLILSSDGVAEKNLVWKDTVLIPTGKYVDILVDMSNPGMWMAHCHIVEHLFGGMMFHYSVEE